MSLCRCSTSARQRSFLPPRALSSLYCSLHFTAQLMASSGQLLLNLKTFYWVALPQLILCFGASTSQRCWPLFLTYAFWWLGFYFGGSCRHLRRLLYWPLVRFAFCASSARVTPGSSTTAVLWHGHPALSISQKRKMFLTLVLPLACSRR